MILSKLNLNTLCLFHSSLFLFVLYTGLLFMEPVFTCRISQAHHGKVERIFSCLNRNCCEKKFWTIKTRMKNHVFDLRRWEKRINEHACLYAITDYRFIINEVFVYYRFVEQEPRASFNITLLPYNRLDNRWIRNGYRDGNASPGGDMPRQEATSCLLAARLRTSAISGRLQIILRLEI